MAQANYQSFKVIFYPIFMAWEGSVVMHRGNFVMLNIYLLTGLVGAINIPRVLTTVRCSTPASENCDCYALICVSRLSRLSWIEA